MKRIPYMLTNLCPEESPYWELYQEVHGHILGADHVRDFPLFHRMAEEWDFVERLPLYTPHYMSRSNIVDHLYRFRTSSNQYVYVFSPYYAARKSIEDAHLYFLNEIIKMNPSQLGVYYPDQSYYNPHTFTFVFKGFPGRRAYAFVKKEEEE